MAVSLQGTNFLVYDSLIGAGFGAMVGALSAPYLCTTNIFSSRFECIIKISEVCHVVETHCFVRNGWFCQRDLAILTIGTGIIVGCSARAVAAKISNYFAKTNESSKKPFNIPKLISVLASHEERAFSDAYDLDSGSGSSD